MTWRRNLMAGAAVLALATAEPRRAEAIAYASEFTQILNNLELAWGNVQQLQQLYNEAMMLAKSGFDMSGSIGGKLSRIEGLMGRYENLVWDTEAVVDQYGEAYPEAFPEINAEIVLLNREMQLELQRDASMASKQVSAEIMTQLKDVTGDIEDVAHASASAEGQTSAIEVGTQASLLNAELLQKLLALQSAHYRTVETEADARMSAEVRSMAYTKHLWRNVPETGEGASE